MNEGEGVAYHQAGHAVMAYIRKVDFESVTALPGERHEGDLVGCKYESSVADGLDGPNAQSYRDTGRIEIGLAGLFARALHVGGFTPGREVAETYVGAMNACLKGADDDAVQCALVREVRHGNASVGHNLMDEVLSSPYARDILFDVSDQWHLVEAVVSALLERGSLTQAEVQKIVEAKER